MNIRAKYRSGKWDLHAHTYWSDGQLDVADSIEKRLEIANVIGISDHYRYLIDNSSLDDYVDDIRYYSNYYHAHPDTDIVVKLGVEIFFEDLFVTGEEEIVINSDIKKYDWDFIIIEGFERVGNQHLVAEVLGELVKSLKMTGNDEYDLILAHPGFDIWFPRLDKTIGIDTMLRFLRTHGIALEMNVNQGYFYRITNYKIEAIKQLIRSKKGYTLNYLIKNESILSIGTDSHGYEETLMDLFTESYNYFLSEGFEHDKLAIK